MYTSKDLKQAWSNDPRWTGIKRRYSSSEVLKLQGSLVIQQSLATLGAQKFWQQLHDPEQCIALGALSGSQAVNMVRAGLKAIYVSGWQVAADANQSWQTYPDQSLYPANSVPQLVERIQNALMRADQIECCETASTKDWYVPIVADAEAGFGGPLHAFELSKAMIAAGAAAIHFEDQLASEKKCGHLGGKVLVPTSQFIKTLSAARLAADVCAVPTVIIARTDALAATMLTSDYDANDREFLTGERTPEGFYRISPGLNAAIARGLAYAPYADLLWFESSTPDLDEAQRFAAAIHSHYPDKLLAYNCSPSFNWSQKLSEEEIADFQSNLNSFGYKFQFITLAGWHLNNYHTFDLAREYKRLGMPAFAKLQRAEIAKVDEGYTAIKHQREVGTGYFDQVLMTITRGEASTKALDGSTENMQFKNLQGRGSEHTIPLQ